MRTLFDEFFVKYTEPNPVFLLKEQFFPERDGTKMLALPIVQIAQFRSGLTTLSIDPTGRSKISIGPVSNVPGDPFRLVEGQQYFAFSCYKINPDADEYFPFEIIGNINSMSGMMVHSAPVIYTQDNPIFSRSNVHAVEGAVGFTFFLGGRPMDIRSGIAVAYAHITGEGYDPSEDINEETTDNRESEGETGEEGEPLPDSSSENV